MCAHVCNPGGTDRLFDLVNWQHFGIKNINVLSSSIPHEPCGNKDEIFHISVPASVWTHRLCTTLRNRENRLKTKISIYFFIFYGTSHWNVSPKNTS